MAPKSSAVTVNMGTWSAAEDERLKEAVAKYGTRWACVAGEVGTRNGDQCAKRWTSNLNPELDHSRWTPEEDQLLLQLVETYGREWKFMADSFLEARAPLAIKNRYSLLMRRLKRNLKQSRGSISEGDLTRPSSRMGFTGDEMASVWTTDAHSGPATAVGTGTTTPIEGLQDSWGAGAGGAGEHADANFLENNAVLAESQEQLNASAAAPPHSLSPLHLPVSESAWQSILVGLDTSFNIAGPAGGAAELDEAPDCNKAAIATARTVSSAVDLNHTPEQIVCRRGTTKQKASPLSTSPATAVCSSIAGDVTTGLFEDGSYAESASASTTSYCADGAIEYTVTCPRADVKTLASHLLDTAMMRILPEDDNVTLTLRLQRAV